MKIKNREAVLDIAKVWQKEGLRLTVICHTCDTPVSYIRDAGKDIGYICPVCKTEWIWEGK